MKIDKKLIKELVDHLEEFKLTELEYRDGDKKIKVSRTAKGIIESKSNTVVSNNKAVLSGEENAVDLAKENLDKMTVADLIEAMKVMESDENLRFKALLRKVKIF